MDEETKTILESMGNAIRKRRRLKKLSQRQLATRINLPLTRVATIEDGEYGAGVKHLVAIGRALGIDPEDMETKLVRIFEENGA